MSDRSAEHPDSRSNRETALRRADQIFDAYEREWIAGREPKMADFLAIVPAAERASIQRELEHIAKDYRQVQKRPPAQTEERGQNDAASHKGAEGSPHSGGSSGYRIAHVLASPGAEPDDFRPDVPDGRSKGPASAADGTATSELDGALPANAIRGYSIVRELSRGGQGVVYQAVQESTKQTVALKVLLQGQFAEASQRRRFEREIELVGSLHHPNIAKIFDSGVDKGQFYFAMQYIRGQRFTDHARDSQFSVTGSLRLFKKVCDAVDHAHQHGVIHRDLKPSNILVDERDQQPYVLDFGLAKFGGAGDARSLDVSITGQVLGTPAYMSPEQAAGESDEVDMRSDVYSLGVIAYEMLTGQLPYNVTGRISDVLNAIQHDEPKRLRSINRQIRDEIDTIVMKALAKDRLRRYPTAGSFGADIQRFIDGEAIEAKRDSLLYMAKRILRRYRLAAAISAAFILVVCVSFISSLTFWKRAVDDRDLALIAQSRETSARAAADHARVKAEQIATEQERRAYNGYIARAAAALDDDNAAMMKLMLDSCTNPELRGWEWHYLHSLVDQSELRLDSNQVNTMAQSADGRWLASGGQDGYVRIWDLEKRQLARTLGDPGSNIISSVDFSPDGERIVVGDTGTPEIGHGKPTTIKIWDVPTGEMCEFGDEFVLLSVAWDPTGRWIASGSYGGSAKLWDSQNNFASHVVHEILYTKASSVRFSPDGASLLASFDDRLALWDVATKDQVWMQIAETEAVGHTAFSPRGDTIVWGTKELFGHESMESWDASTGQSRLKFSGHCGSATCVTYSSNGNRIISGGSDNTLRLWSASDGELLETFRGHSDTVRGVAFLRRDEDRIVSAGDDGIRIWRREPPPEVVTLNDHGAAVTAVAFSPDGKRLVSASVDRTVRLWDVESARQLEQWWDGGWVLDIAFSQDGKHIASVCYADRSKSERGIKQVRVWDVDAHWQNRWDHRHSNFIESLNVPREPFHLESVAFGDNGSKLATHQHRYIQLWDVDSRQQISKLDLGDPITRQAFSLDGAYLAVCRQYQPGITLVDARANPPRLLPRLRDLPFYPISVCFDDSGRRIASGTANGTAYIVDVATGRSTELIGHSGPVVALAFHPQGNRLITGSRDRTVKIWNAHTGEELLTLRGHAKTVTSVAVSPDGQTIATASDDATIRLWRTSAPSRSE